MRVKYIFNSNRPVVIPIHYNHLVQAMIYTNLSEDFAEFLHEHGYKYGKRKFKLFTFSRLEGRFKIKGNNIAFFPPLHLIVASPINRFVQELTSGFIKNDYIHLSNQPLTLENVSVYTPIEAPDFKEETKIQMLSPMVAYRSYIDKENKQKTVYFSPEDDDFVELLKRNLWRKYILLNGKELNDVYFDIEPVYPINEKNFNVLKYKNTIIKGYTGVYKITGDPSLKKIAYETGLGSKNSQGFGCFRVLKG